MENNKRILITGATGSIGSTLCQYLISKEYDLILTSRSIDHLSQLSNKLHPKYANKISCIPSDFCEPASFIPLHQACHPSLDGLVLITPRIKPTSDCLPEDECWEAIFKKCFIGPLGLIKSLLPVLKSNQKAKVVIISGVSSMQVLSHYAHNNAIRAAWVAQAKTLAFAFGSEGIHFNTLSLGGVITEEFIKQLQLEALENDKTYAEVLDQRINNVPLKKYASLQNVAHAIEGLLSNFSDHITGMNICCDGGFTRAY